MPRRRKAAQVTEPAKRKRVLVSCCNGTGWIHKLVVHALIRIVADPRYDAHLLMPTHRPYVNNLHLVVRDVLAGGFDYWLNIDDDNPPNRNPLDLVELDLDIVGCPTPVWHSSASAPPGDRPYYYNAMMEAETGDGVAFRPADSLPGFVGAGIQQVDAMGTGCVLVARRVLEELTARAKRSGDPRDAPLFRLWEPDGVVRLGNDFAFCQRARAAGFRVYAHWDYTCEHMAELPLSEAIGAMLKFRQADHG